MELTKEHFDQVLKNLATKKDLDAGLAASEKRIVKRIDEAQEELARMVADGFSDLQTRLDVTEQIKSFERFQKLEEALHIKLGGQPARGGCCSPRLTTRAGGSPTQPRPEVRRLGDALMRIVRLLQIAITPN